MAQNDERKDVPGERQPQGRQPENGSPSGGKRSDRSGDNTAKAVAAVVIAALLLYGGSKFLGTTLKKTKAPVTSPAEVLVPEDVKELELPVTSDAAAVHAAAEPEAERLEAEKREAERLEAEKREAERLEAEKREAERLEAEKREAERLEAEKREAERLEAEKREAERLEAEKREAERLEAEKREAERLEAEKREAERLEAEKREAERLEAAAGKPEEEEFRPEDRKDLEQGFIKTEAPEGPRWDMQIGAFVIRNNALNLREKTLGEGFEPYITERDVRGRHFYRVRIKGAETKEGAAEVVARLRERGYPIWRLPKKQRPSLK